MNFLGRILEIKQRGVESKPALSLKTVGYKEVKQFSFEGHKCQAKCVKVSDGDTAIFVFYYAGQLHQFRIRLAEIDTPALDGETDEERKLAIRAKQRLSELIENKVVYLVCGKFEKYGRILAKIYLVSETESINDLLVREKLACSYDGGKKTLFAQWNPSN